ncbi:tRNA methyltransferase 10 homolog B isoform X6 [Hippocampus zosterae]|uniref:tRNA methyltransferase 10 homolog B isoform X6 n=1 Tax=Hippocampus zosterae TaxID=109293 RepID=UPI00223E2529|nr:tRNA methyltransferase 10 homolog B isoform X6 [Hippocampus zosterae]
MFFDSFSSVKFYFEYDDYLCSVEHAKMTEMVSESSEEQTNGVWEMMELLDIDVLEEERAEEPDDAPQAPLSKNASRKQRHWERTLAARKSKRREEKRRRRLNRHSEVEGDAARRQLTKRDAKAAIRERLAEARVSGLKVCVDLSMSHRMSDKETSRLAAQLRRLYGSNRRASKPFRLFLTGLREDSRLLAECVRMNDGFLDYALERTEQSCLDVFPAESVVYLSPDAQEALERVDGDTVYVLGGLVDESVQKALSLSRAEELGVRAARLPIDEHMRKTPNAKNFHSKILAVNQVFDILLAAYHTGSWTLALDKCFPRSKGYAVAPQGHLASGQ